MVFLKGGALISIPIPLVEKALGSTIPLDGSVLIDSFFDPAENRLYFIPWINKKPRGGASTLKAWKPIKNVYSIYISSSILRQKIGIGESRTIRKARAFKGRIKVEL